MSEEHTRAHERAAPMLTQRSGPLTDVRVVDLTRALAGPYCTMVLGDMGADVIKVESLPDGDSVRLIGPHTEVDGDHHFGGYFASNNRNKRSVLLDFDDDADIERLRKLIDTADVVVENFRPGNMERLGLAYEDLRARNPKLVYAAIRGFGDPRTGESPFADWPAYDIVAQAMGGVVSCTGTTSGEHVASGPSIGDLVPAVMAVVAVLGALHHARRTGEGQFVDVAMVDSVMALCESVMWRYSYTGEIQQPRGTQHPSLCPFEIYRTGDGEVAIAAPTDRHWRALCDIVGRADLKDDDRTKSSRRRVVHRPLVTEALEEWTTARSTDDVVRELAGRVPVGPVNAAPDLIASAHVQARQMLVAVEHPGSARPVVAPNTPLRFTATPGGVYRRAPILGEHTEEVMAEVEGREPTNDPTTNEPTMNDPTMNDIGELTQK
ncbi:MAG: CoA transferase [Acidimicrobiales bacterium]|nr:CoA transferase [Acidimicrobiales bacterium]